MVVLLKQNQHGQTWNIIQSHENWLQTFRAVFFLQAAFGQQSASEHGDGDGGSRELLAAALGHGRVHLGAGLKRHKRRTLLSGEEG